MGFMTKHMGTITGFVVGVVVGVLGYHLTTSKGIEIKTETVTTVETTEEE